MIDYKIPFGFNLTKTTVIIEDIELNLNSQSAPFDFTGTPILFITIQNKTSVNFNNIYLSDGGGNTITHHSGVNSTKYSIAFSGNATGQPFVLPILTDLNAVTVNWTFPGSAVGFITINIYTFAI